MGLVNLVRDFTPIQAAAPESEYTPVKVIKADLSSNGNNSQARTGASNTYLTHGSTQVTGMTGNFTDFRMNDTRPENFI